MTLLTFLVGLWLLSACTTPPFTINLPEVSINFKIVGETFGKVVFPNNPLKPNNSLPPGTSVASLTIRGKAELDKIANQSFEIFASTKSPEGLRCDPILNTSYYLCDSNKVVSVGIIRFDKTQGPVDFQLNDKEQVLSTGVNQNSLYLGAKITGVTTINETLRLYDLTATVQLNIGK